MRLKIVNRQEQPASFRLAVADDTPARLVLDEDPVVVSAGASVTRGFLVVTPASVFTDGKRDVVFRVSGAGEPQELKYRLLGPITAGGR